MRVRLKRFALLLTLAALLGPASVALAAGGPPKHLAPPGNPAVSEYLEDVPTAGGAAPPGSGGKPAHTLSPNQQRQLGRMGKNGQALENVVNETAPPAAPDTPKGGGHGASGRRGSGSGRAGAGSDRAGADPSPGHSIRPASSSSSGSPTSAVLSAATGRGGGGGMGVFLPVLVGLGVLSVVVTLIRRRGVSRS